MYYISLYDRTFESKFTHHLRHVKVSLTIFLKISKHKNSLCFVVCSHADSYGFYCN